MGEIRVTKDVSDGNCAAREVGVKLSGKPASDLPTLEYGYELRAAIVLRQHGKYFEMALHGRTAWVRAEDAGEFLPVPRLFADQLLYLTRHAPGAGALDATEPNVEVVGTEGAGQQL